MSQNDEQMPPGKDTERPGAHRVPPARRVYHPPSLTPYGSIARLTQSGGATQLEGASGRNRMD